MGWKTPFAGASLDRNGLVTANIGKFRGGHFGKMSELDCERWSSSLPFRLALLSHFAIGAAVRDDPTAAAGLYPPR